MHQVNNELIYYIGILYIFIKCFIHFNIGKGYQTPYNSSNGIIPKPIYNLTNDNHGFIGGGGGEDHGGNGGGLIILECYGNIIMNEYTSISCNGLEGVDKFDGNGLGGYIYIKCNKLILNNGCSIESMGAEHMEILGRQRHRSNKSSKSIHLNTNELETESKGELKSNDDNKNITKPKAFDGIIRLNINDNDSVNDIKNNIIPKKLIKPIPWIYGVNYFENSNDNYNIIPRNQLRFELSRSNDDFSNNINDTNLRDNPEALFASMKPYTPEETNQMCVINILYLYIISNNIYPYIRYKIDLGIMILICEI